MPAKECQRLCMDDMCRFGITLCGGEYCEHCGRLAMFDQRVCDDCREAMRTEDDDDCGGSL